MQNRDAVADLLHDAVDDWANGELSDWTFLFLIKSLVERPSNEDAEKAQEWGRKKMAGQLSALDIVSVDGS
jgi:hypothetical protein